MTLARITQSPTDPAFVQNPYAFYERARAPGGLVWRNDYGLPCGAVNAILRDRRFGREVPESKRKPIPDHVAPVYAAEAHSMLKLEPPRHTRLRGLVLRAFSLNVGEGEIALTAAAPTAHSTSIPPTLNATTRRPTRRPQ